VTLRTSAAHWSKLSMMLSSFEKCVEACSRLDAYRVSANRVKGERRDMHAFDCRIDALRMMLDKEIDRVTAERLLLDLSVKKLAAA
jgi:hypothetical protein